METIRMILEDCPKIEVTEANGIVSLGIDGTECFYGPVAEALAWAKGFALCSSIEW